MVANLFGCIWGAMIRRFVDSMYVMHLQMTTLELPSISEPDEWRTARQPVRYCTCVDEDQRCIYVIGIAAPSAFLHVLNRDGTTGTFCRPLLLPCVPSPPPAP